MRKGRRERIEKGSRGDREKGKRQKDNLKRRRASETPLFIISRSNSAM